MLIGFSIGKDGIFYVSDVGHMMFNSSAYWCFSWERWYILYVSDVGRVVGVL
jgi:hypothetical protein